MAFVCVLFIEAERESDRERAIIVWHHPFGAHMWDSNVNTRHNKWKILNSNKSSKNNVNAWFVCAEHWLSAVAVAAANALVLVVYGYAIMASGSCLWSHRIMSHRVSLKTIWSAHCVYAFALLPIRYVRCRVSVVVYSVRPMTVFGVARWVHDYLFVLFKEVAIYTTCVLMVFFFSETHFDDETSTWRHAAAIWQQRNFQTIVPMDSAAWRLQSTTINSSFHNASINTRNVSDEIYKWKIVFYAAIQKPTFLLCFTIFSHMSNIVVWWFALCLQQWIYLGILPQMSFEFRLIIIITKTSDYTVARKIGRFSRYRQNLATVY